MKEHLIISAMGSDRPGLVNDLSKIILQADGNIDESRMTVLAGEFAIILKVSGNHEALSDLEQQLTDKLPQIGLQHISKLSHIDASGQCLQPYQVHVLSIDHPGIVNQLSDFFSVKKINIQNLQTERYSAPHTGTRMFSMDMVIALSEDIIIADLKDEFLHFCDELNLDAEIEALT